MKRLFTVVLLTLAISNIVVAQATADNRAEQEMRAINREMRDAGLSGNKAFFERLLTDTFIETDTDGNILTKAQFLADVEPPPASIKPGVDFDDVRVQSYGDTAVVNFRGNYRLEAGGQKISTFVRITNIFVRREGRWQLVAEQRSRIPPERTVANVAPKILNAFTGQYEFAPNVIFTITREGNKLIGQTTGQQTRVEMLPENETTFFIRGQNSQIVFVKDEKGQVTGMVVHNANGQEMRVKKIK